MTLNTILENSNYGYFSHTSMPDGECFYFLCGEISDYRVDNIIQGQVDKKDLAIEICKQLEQQNVAGFYLTTKYGVKI